EYPRLNLPPPLGESRLVIWILAQQHLYWGSFVLGVLFVVTVLELRGVVGPRSPPQRIYDALAQEMLGLIMLALSITAILGAIFFVSLLSLYPGLTMYLVAVFRPTVLSYGLLALVFTLFV